MERRRAISYAVIEFGAWFKEKGMFDIVHSARKLVDTSWETEFSDFRIEERVSKTS